MRPAPMEAGRALYIYCEPIRGRLLKDEPLAAETARAGGGVNMAARRKCQGRT